MAQKIMLTEELRQSMVEEFRKQLDSLRVTTQTVNFTQKLAGYSEPAQLIYSPIAWVKQRLLVESVDKEIAWYGLMERRDETAIPTYYVKDIVVYPQRTTAVTVEVDQDVYPEWYGNQPDEFYTEMRMQGHSHVNMATSPSGDDREHWDELVAKVPADSFFVCVIANKKMEHYVNIFDFRRNTRYDSSDVTIFVEDLSLKAFLADVKDKLTSIPTPVYSSYGAGRTATGAAASGFRSGTYNYAAWDDPYDDWSSWDDPYHPETPAKSTSSPKSSFSKAAPVSKSSGLPVPPAPKGNIPGASGFPSYTSKFGKRG